MKMLQSKMNTAVSLFVVVTLLLSCLTSTAQAQEEVKADGDWYSSMFSTLDLNHDGLLDLNEYQTGRSNLQQAFASHGEGGKKSIFNLDGFWKAASSALAMIIATEIGDKTFFIAAVLSMKHDRSAVFGGAVLALAIMTILSTAMGLILPQLVDRRYTHILGGLLFLYFGVKLSLDARSMEAGKASEELEEVEEELLQVNKKKDTHDEEAGMASSKTQKRGRLSFFNVAWQALTLTFIAEWGDRSQIATIALGAAKNPIGVTVGGCLGHAICTGLAVLGGRMLAARISEKTVNQGGGVVFLLFGVHSIFLEN
jgi:putative Ca2+/H+ antiporter (TMEM165/GDT1 family)